MLLDKDIIQKPPISRIILYKLYSKLYSIIYATKTEICRMKKSIVQLRGGSFFYPNLAVEEVSNHKLILGHSYLTILKHC